MGTGYSGRCPNDRNNWDVYDAVCRNGRLAWRKFDCVLRERALCVRHASQMPPAVVRVVLAFSPGFVDGFALCVWSAGGVSWTSALFEGACLGARALLLPLTPAAWATLELVRVKAWRELDHRVPYTNIAVIAGAAAGAQHGFCRAYDFRCPIEPSVVAQRHLSCWNATTDVRVTSWAAQVPDGQGLPAAGRHGRRGHGVVASLGGRVLKTQSPDSARGLDCR